MVKIPNKILKIINEFVRESVNDDIPLQEVVLFGSYAKGNFHEYSDIDLAVVSDKFEGNSINDAMLLFDTKYKVSIDLELHPYRPEEFTPENPFVREILEHGIRIV